LACWGSSRHRMCRSARRSKLSGSCRGRGGQRRASRSPSNIPYPIRNSGL
jgi:hypothetical protein